MSGPFDPNGADSAASRPSSDGRGGRHLPPPAFPPGARRVGVPKPQASSDDLAAALIQPDDPIPERDGGVPAEAFISPDEQIRRRAPRMPALAKEEVDPDDVVVTGIGDDAHMTPDELTAGFDPYVLEVVDEVSKLAEALKRKGEAGLRMTPEMPRFAATLRSYCVGYLAGRRAADEET